MALEETITLTMSKQRYDEILNIEKEILFGFDPKKDRHLIVSDGNYFLKLLTVKNVDGSEEYLLKEYERMEKENKELKSKIKEAYTEELKKITDKLDSSFWVRLGFLFKIK